MAIVTIEILVIVFSIIIYVAGLFFLYTKENGTSNASAGDQSRESGDIETGEPQSTTNCESTENETIEEVICDRNDQSRELNDIESGELQSTTNCESTTSE